METSMKRVLSLLVAFVMVLSLIPASPIHVHAAEGEETPADTTETTVAPEEETEPVMDETHVAPTPTLDTTVAMVNGKEYTTLEAAAGAVPAMTSEDDDFTVIDIVANLTIDARVRFPYKKAIIYMNGHTITLKSSESDYGQFMIGYGSDTVELAPHVIINGGKFVLGNTKAQAMLSLYHKSKVTLNSVEICSGGADCYAFIASHAGSYEYMLTLNQCEIDIGNSTFASYMFGGGTASSDYNGTLVVNGGSFTFAPDTKPTSNNILNGVVLQATDWTVNVENAFRFTCHTGGFMHNCTVNVSDSTNDFYFNATHQTSTTPKQPLKLTGTTTVSTTDASPANAKSIYLYDTVSYTVNGTQPKDCVEYFAKFNSVDYLTVQEAVDAAAENGGIVTVSRSNAQAAVLPEGVTLQVASGVNYTGAVTAEGTLYTVDHNAETNTYTVIKNPNIVLSVWNGETFVAAYESFGTKTLAGIASGNTAVLEKDYALDTTDAATLYNTITLNLNGHTLTLTGTASFSLMNKANLTIKNGTVLENSTQNTNRFTAGGAENCSITFEDVRFTNIAADGTVYLTGTGTIFYVNPGKGQKNDETGLYTIAFNDTEMIFKDCELEYENSSHNYIFNGYVWNTANIVSQVPAYGKITVENFDISIDNVDTDAYQKGQVIYGIDLQDSYGLNITAKGMQRMICRVQGNLSDSTLVGESCKNELYIAAHAFVKNDLHAEEYAWVRTPLHLTGNSTLNVAKIETLTDDLLELDASVTVSDNLIGKGVVHYADHAGTHYTTVQAAIEAAADAYATSSETETVTLLGNADETVVVPTGVSVNKNGYTITGISCADGCVFTAVDNGNGTHTKTCSGCGTVITEEHTPDNGDYTDPVKGEKDGFWTYTCTVDGCNHSYVVVDKDSATPAGMVSYIADADGNRTYYDSVTSAAAALTAGQTLTLVENVNVSSMMVMAGTALDLNGYTLNVNNAFAAFGEITGDGVLKVTNSSNITLPGQKTTLALWDAEAEGYRFVSNEHYNITDYAAMQGSGENSYLMFWAQVEDGSVLDSLMANGFADNGLKLVVHLEYSIEVNGEKLPLSVDVDYEPLLDDLANANGSTLTLSLGNAVDFPDLTYSIKFVSEAGYEIVGASGAWFPAA